MDSNLLNHRAEKLRKFKIRQEDLDAVKQTCGEYGISDEVYVTLVGCVIELAEFKHIHKPKMRTGSQKKKDLEQVLIAACELELALKSLDRDGALLLGEFFEKCGFAEDDSDPPNLRSLRAGKNAVHKVIQATLDAMGKMHERGLDKPGRVKTLEDHARVIAIAAINLRNFNIVPGDNGPFRRICDSLFNAAGAGSTAQGAIKYFQKQWRPALKDMQACL